MRVLLTRPYHDSARVATALTSRGIGTVIWPMIEVRPTVRMIEVPTGTDAIAFTSANAVRIFAGLVDTCDLAALSVGDRTAIVAKAAGFTDVYSADGNVDDLAKLIGLGGWTQIFHPHGRNVAGDLGDALHAAGVMVHGAEIYETVPTAPPSPDLSAELVSSEIDVVTLWSPRSAELFSAANRLFGKLDLSGAVALAISQNTANPLESSDFKRVDVAEHPSAEGMLASLDALHRAMRQ